MFRDLQVELGEIVQVITLHFFYRGGKSLYVVFLHSNINIIIENNVPKK